MSKKFEFKCDNCTRHLPAKFNGEHWLPPKGWIQIYDPNQGDMRDEHRCDKCYTDRIREPMPEEATTPAGTLPK